MSFQLRDDETLGDGLRRIICERIDQAIAAGSERHNGKSSPVHTTRKRLKQARAALRMISKESGAGPRAGRHAACATWRG